MRNLSRALNSEEIQRILARELTSPLPEGVIITAAAPIRACDSQTCMTFITKGAADPEAQELLSGIKQGVVLVKDPELVLKNERVLLIRVKNPRLALSLLLQAVRERRTFPSHRPGVWIHPDARLGEEVEIGPGCYIGRAHIGNRVIIYPNVTILEDVTIGDDVTIGPGTVIGFSGFGLERDESGTPIRVTHLGGVRVGRGVEIGAHVTIDRGTFDDTVLGDEVKVDHHVHIGHNCQIGARTLLTAGAILGGSSQIEEESWIGLNATTLQGLKVGRGSTLGIGAVAVRDVPDGATVAGNPARVLSQP